MHVCRNQIWLKMEKMVTLFSCRTRLLSGFFQLLFLKFDLVEGLAEYVQSHP